MSPFLRSSSERRRGKKKSESVLLRTARWAAAVFSVVFLA